MRLVDLINQNNNVQKWESLLKKSSRQLILGLSGTTKVLAIASAFKTVAGKLLLITSN